MRGIEFDRRWGMGSLYSKLPPQMQLSIHDISPIQSFSSLILFTVPLLFFHCPVDKYFVCMKSMLYSILVDVFIEH